MRARAPSPIRADDRDVDARDVDTVTTVLARRARELAASIALQSFLCVMSVLVGVVSSVRRLTPAPPREDDGRGRRWAYAQGVRRPSLRRRVNAARAHATRDEKTHLVACVHGLGGTPDDLCAMEARLVRERSVVVHRVTRNAPLNSFDGVEAGARRLVEELREVKAKYPNLRYVSLYGNSLGGIYARYAAGLMYAEDGGRGTMMGLSPCTYLTTATPHLGVGPWGYFKLVPRALQNLWSRNLGRSIMELTLRDGDAKSDMKPLLERMADPETKEPIDFIAALGAFERRCAYSNCVNDFLVSLETAAIRPEHLDRDLERRWRSLDKPQIIEEYVIEGGSAGDAVSKGDALDARRRMANGLRSVTWKHVNVCFPGPSPLAHNKICALQRNKVVEGLFKEGEFIVDHQAAYLLEPVLERNRREE
jgi:hypothetical protein